MEHPEPVQSNPHSSNFNIRFNIIS